MKKSYRKNIFREIGSSKHRFFAILVIVALGVCMFTGLIVTSPNMKYTADRYFDQTNLMDLRILSTLGLTENDLEQIAQTEGVEGVMGLKSADALFLAQNGDTLAGKIQSIPQNTDPANPDYLNQFTLTEGRMPQAPNECVVLNTNIFEGTDIGETISLSPENQDLSETLSQTEWEIVGKVSVPTNFSIETETVSVGDGQADILVYAPMESFSGDIYTTAFVSVQNTKPLQTYSQEYEDTVSAVCEELEQLGIAQSEIRKNEVITQAQQELDNAKAEYESKKADAQAQLDLAQAKLNDAEAVINQKEQELLQGETEWKNGTALLQQQKNQLSQTLAQKQQEITAARQQITNGKQQLNLAKQQLAASETQYQQAVFAQQQVESGKQQLEQAKQQLALAEQAVAAAEKMLPTLEKTAQAAQQAAQTAKQQAEQAENEHNTLLQREDIQQGLSYKSELDTVLSQYPEYSTIDQLLQNPPETLSPEQIADLTAKNEQYKSAQAQVDNANLKADAANLAAQQTQQAADSAQAVYQSTKQSLEQGKQTVDSSKQLIAEKESQLKQAEEMLSQYADILEKAPTLIEQGKQEISKNETALQQAENQLQDGILALSLAPSQAELEFEKAQQQLDEAKQLLDDGKQQLEQGKQELQDGKKEFETEKANAEQQLNDAEDKLIDAQREIDKIDSCEWFVLDRNSLLPYATFESNADKLASIATVFPVFFFLVAALVALTTMTRMIDENRTQIGVFKALGYSESAITAKYLLYAAAAGISGSAIGIAAGFGIIPLLLWNAYAAMYRLPKFYLRFDPALAAVAAGVGVLCTAGTAIAACHSTLKEKPASLLMPKAPKAGKRILLERIPFVWGKMKFTHKVTARNLFRYKKRFFMTVTGIAGCTALLMVGFGIQDSIVDLMDTQYQQIWHYDLSIGLNHPSALEGRRGIGDILNNKNTVSESVVLYQKNADVSSANGETLNLTVTVPQNSSTFLDFVTLRNRTSKNSVPFDSDSVVMTEKAAEILGLNVGDTFTLTHDNLPLSLTLTGITESYLGSNLYLSPDLWEQTVGTPEWNTVFAKTTCETPEQRSNLSQQLLEKSDVKSAVFTEDASKVFSDAIQNINQVVVVVILFAALLAVVVLYNLININVGERKKELATIKVLGFFDKEVSKYIFREIDTLSIIGSVCGLVLGVPLHQFVIKTVEMDQMMFIRTIDWTSYLYSFLLTMLFTLAVSLIMKPSLKKIDMVESLKAPE